MERTRYFFVIVFNIIIIGNLYCQVNCSTFNVNSSWDYVKHYSWKTTSFSNNELDLLKKNKLHILKNSIYFDNIDFIDTCEFSHVVIEDFYSKSNKLFYPEEQRLMVRYDSSELKSIKRIILDCDYNCLGLLYFKQDTLINICGGYTFYLITNSDNQ